MRADNTLSLASFLALSLGLGPVRPHAVPHAGDWRYHHAFVDHPSLAFGASPAAVETPASAGAAGRAVRAPCGQSVGGWVHA